MHGVQFKLHRPIQFGMALDELEDEGERLRVLNEVAKWTLFELRCQEHEHALIEQELQWRREHSLIVLPWSIVHPPHDSLDPWWP